MSDAVSNAEVEDVLSSIRRLVSEDRRVVSKVTDNVPSEEKLVLTPSLRVANDAPLSDGNRAPRSVDVSDQATDAITDGDAMPASPTETGSEQGEENAPSDTAGSGTVTNFKQRSDILNLGVSELVDESVKSDGADRLSAKIAALETAIGRISDGWDVEEREVNDFVSPEPLAMAWEDDIELDATGAPITASPDAVPTKGAAMMDDTIVDAGPYVEEEDAASESPDKTVGAEEYFDEDMLREMVEEIVRKELQGALGERITRNVRKLVRREIHRALTAQDLE
ncbi:hypothetical protein SAMN04488040_1451 [Sulfitobacter marinus]|uniref:Uncharacterized protein n=1 Tax=Sulfitobacter marinus TaxID=394264 RepID=A0A1I6RSC9_9RHOB|nr:hypothetical protein [Sulfitobacter marinus]SFS67605.1 hypothetical protein SAMN04488040_1451 [Sulfitobacter marinus]